MPDKIFYPQPIIPPVSSSKTKATVARTQNVEVDFKQKLLEALKQEEGIKFSKHALERIKMRRINLSTERLAKLEEAVEKAASKGAKDSLILMKDMAFVVSIKNRTVITAVDQENLKENVFTNIDSAVITE